MVRETRKEPLRIEEWQTSLDKKKFGPLYRKDARAVEASVEALTQDMLGNLSIGLRNDGKISLDVDGVGKVEITKDLINIERRTRVENVREFTPNVIEPSFGIGRILYALCEHSYWTRFEDEARGVSWMFSCQPRTNFG
jgi:glycyl-tRNA synthetase